MIAFRGATAWEAQIGRLWVRIKFPRYWLWNAVRAGYYRRHGPIPGNGAPRTVLFAWPGSIGWETES